MVLQVRDKSTVVVLSPVLPLPVEVDVSGDAVVDLDSLAVVEWAGSQVQLRVPCFSLSLVSVSPVVPHSRLLGR